VSDDASLAQLAPQLTDQFVPGRDFRSVDGEHARARCMVGKRRPSAEHYPVHRLITGTWVVFAW